MLDTMEASQTPRRPRQILAEAVGVGILCAVVAIAWMLLSKRNLGPDDYKFLVPTFFGAGAIVYAAGELIAGGRMAGAFLGALLGMLMLGWLIQFVVERDHVIARLIGPGVGFFVGSVVGAVVEGKLRGPLGSVRQSAEAEEQSGPT